ncbi:MAG: serine/threonine protein kinase [Cyanobacteria bacterium]|nr:serine/threonine protein kinase [Cyanobacteriota bacterium]
MSPQEFKENPKVQEWIVDDEIVVEQSSQPIVVQSPSRNEDKLIGKTIAGHYEIVEKIGQGGMSKVYRAHHKLLNRCVALKLIRSNLLDDTRVIERFQREAQAAAGLKHPNICCVNDIGIYEDQPYIVMDLLTGVSLADLLEQEGKLSIETAIALIIQTCTGLAFAHSQGIVHRDIKPGNIICELDDATGKQTVRLVDFGIAKVLRDDNDGPNLTQTGEIFGTPSYMSPEQCLGLKIDTRSDVYAIGCVLCEMVTGSPPFKSATVLGTVSMHAHEPIPEIRTSNEGLNAVIYRCLQKDPADRYQQVEDLISDLHLALAGKVPERPIELFRYWRDKKPGSTFSISVSRKTGLILLAAWVIMLIVLLSRDYSISFGDYHFGYKSLPTRISELLVVEGAKDDIKKGRNLEAAKKKALLLVKNHNPEGAETIALAIAEQGGFDSSSDIAMECLKKGGVNEANNIALDLWQRKQLDKAAQILEAMANAILPKIDGQLEKNLREIHREIESSAHSNEH